MRKFQNKFKRKPFKKMNRKRKKHSKGISFLGKHAKTKYTQSLPIYALQVMGGISMYGFDVGYTGSSLSLQALENLWSDSAFLAMQKNYGYMRIHGMSINIARQLPVNQISISAATPFSLGLTSVNDQTQNITLTNTSGIASNNYDVSNHIKYVNENETGWWSKYYSFDKETIAGGIETAGSMTYNILPIGKTWIPTTSASINGLQDLIIVIGFDLPPTFASTATDQAVTVAQMDLTFYVEFALQRGATVVVP